MSRYEGQSVSEILARLVGRRPDARNNTLLIEHIRLAEQTHGVPPAERLPLQPRETP